MELVSLYANRYGVRKLGVIKALSSSRLIVCVDSLIPFIYLGTMITASLSLMVLFGTFLADSDMTVTPRFRVIAYPECPLGNLTNDLCGLQKLGSQFHKAAEDCEVCVRFKLTDPVSSASNV